MTRRCQWQRWVTVNKLSQPVEFQKALIFKDTIKSIQQWVNYTKAIEAQEQKNLGCLNKKLWLSSVIDNAELNLHLRTCKFGIIWKKTCVKLRPGDIW
jgi:hypothetical protein